MKLKIKYCGGCNPFIDRSGLFKEVLDKLKSVTEVDIVSDQAEIGLIIAGCPVCCVNQQEFEHQALKWVVVSGTLLNQVDVPLSQLPGRVCQEILSRKQAC
jgi:hypothetical protein